MSTQDLTVSKMYRLCAMDLPAACIVYVLFAGSALVSIVECNANYKPVIDASQGLLFSVSENTSVGSEIAVINATDSENDPITFSLEESFTLLAINATTGALTLKKSLDREIEDYYTFKVYAADNYVGGDRRGEQTFYLNVEDANDNKPQFVNSPYIGKVAENETIGHEVLQVIASDLDQGANKRVTYKFSSNTQTDKFEINNLDGKISVAGNLDFETVQRYTLFVVAQDAGSPPLESLTTVIVDIIDVSDNAPRFLKSTYLEEVGENTPIGTEIVRVEAVDGDVGVNNPLEFAIVAGNDHGIFKINATSGSITVNGSIDAEMEDFYRVTVRAVEIPDPLFNTTVFVIVTVVDRNDNPPKFPQESYSFSVKEDVARPGYIVTDQLNVRDGDKNPEYRQFEYSISGAEGDKFAVENGILTINATLDYEQKSNYTFEIFANETNTAEKLWGSAVVTVELVNVNDNNPAFDKLLYTFTLQEEVQAGDVIGQITASDADLGAFGEITYELVGEGAALFAVEPSNGTIRTTGLLDYEKSPEYTFALLAKDGGGFYERRNATTIKIVLEDENDNAPVFDGLPYSAKILEGAKNGTSVFQVKATDKDSGDNGRLSYNITAGNTDNAFYINSSGLVWLAKELDREQLPSYSLTVLAYDHGNSSRNQTAIVTVSVEDVNDNKPVVPGAPYISTNLSESSGGGTVVYKLQASDADAGNNKLLTYAITDGNDEGRFILNSGTGILQISPTGLDREISASYNLTVNVTDSGEPVQWQSLVLHVDVLDVNDHTPQFSPPPSDAVYFVEIDEGPGSLGRQVIDVNATDKDDGPNAEIRYSLSGNEQGFFALDAETGVLRVNKTLDRENFTLDARERGVLTLEITATDQAEPPSDRKSATVRVTLYVLDQNDNTPSFVNPPSSVQVSEAARPGTNIVQLSAVDDDSQFNGDVEFNITRGDPEGIFKITSNGKLLVEKTLNAEKVDVYNLTIEAKDKGSPPRASTTLLQVQVDDVNDNDPAFNQSTYSASVLENANLSTPVLTVFAEDPDKGSNGDVLYSIISGDDKGMFAANNKTGLVSVAGVLDREQVLRYTLTVQAEDQGHPSSRKDFASVVITLLDVNDNAPRFTRDSYNAEIQEGASGGSLVEVTEPVRATDEDDGDNAALTFSLSGPGSENFVINATTGIITTSANCSLDRERNSSYTLQLKVTDGGGKSSTADLHVKLLDINDEAPRFAQGIYQANISESAQRGAIVTRVTASDLDEGINKEITYTSTGADAKFYISRATGDIIVDAALDREFKSLYVLNVTAANFGEHSPEGYTQVYITITDVIDDKPFFATEAMTVHVSENVSIGTNVTRVVASDKDIDDTLTYGVVGGDAFKQFDVNSTTGVVTTTKSLNRENSTEVTLLIQARDSLNLTSDNFKLIIKVDDVNDNAPVFTEESYVVQFREESHEGTSILKVAATDADFGLNAEITYSIIGENATNYLSIDANSGQISQGGTKLDREKSPYFNFTVRATDKGTPAKTTEVEVSLQLVDINDNAPVFDKEEYQASVRENLDAGSFVLRVNATDLDIGTNGKILYRRLQGGDSLFDIDPFTGNITTTDRLDRENTGEYTLTVVAQDDGLPFNQGTARVIVTVTDDNDHTPAFAQPQYAFTVKENVNVDHPIGTVLATDGDKDNNSRISYSISSGNTGGVLQISEAGEISVKSKLDREVVPSFTLVVLATDNGAEPRQSNTTIVITVEDVNDNQPRFNQSIYNITLKESTFKRTVVQQVSASDPDALANGEFTFSIYSGNSEDVFEIDAATGVVKLKNQLDYEKTQFYNLTIEAKDSGSPKLSGFAFLLVTVLDVDDNAPVFLQERYEFTLYENATLGAVFGRVNATDVDADKVHSTVNYAIESGDVDGAFSIGHLNGSLYVNPSGPGADREKSEKHELVVAAVSWSNSSGQKSTVPVTVTILDVNDNAPGFLKDGYSKSVYEDVRNLTNQDDSSLLTISASDADQGPNSQVVYTIVSGNEEGLFKLDNVTGVLSKAKMLDREYKDFHSLIVLATDRGVPPLSTNTSVNISILDMNDNHPQMDIKKHAYYISENSTIGTLLTTVDAADEDIDSNGMVQFSFISGNEDGAFELNSQTGELRTAKELDYEIKASYQLTIQAQDRGQPPLSSNDLVTVELRNIDDNRPTFTEKQTSFSVGENLRPGAVVGTLSARDLDGNQIFYYIKEGNEDNAFYLNDTSGVLTTRKTLDREIKEKHILYIQASNVQLDPATLKPRARRDLNTPTISPEPDIQLLEIEVADDNDNPPKFTEEVFTGGVSGDAKYGSDVLRVTAVDPDTGNTSRIAYEILDTTEDGRLFSIVRETGWIQAKESYAKLSGTELVLEVLAMDNFGNEPHFNDTAMVKIYVLTDKLQSVLISTRPPNYVRLRKDELKTILENITGYTINIDDINYYKEGEKYDFSKTAVLFHAVDPATGKVVNRDVVISEIDKNYHRYLEFFNEMKIQEVKPQVEPAEEEEFPVVLAVVIALSIIVGLLLCIFFCVVCNLRKRDEDDPNARLTFAWIPGTNPDIFRELVAQKYPQKRKLRAATAASYGGSSTKAATTGPVTVLPTTNLHTSEGSNPVWVDPFHNWAMKTDEEDMAVDHRNPSPFYGGTLPPVTPDPKMFFDAEELPMDVFRSGHGDASDDDSSSASSTGSWSSGGKKSSSTSRSGEPYESSPVGEPHYVPDASNRYKVTRI